ncbi:MAG: cytochrome c biogenesis protein CcsA [Comamonas sp.]|nr:cytochrome c biogenesis protein CcsA [Comamonas sp.]
MELPPRFLAHPSWWTLLPSALAILAYVAPALLGRRLAATQARTALALAWALHALALVVNMLAPPPRFGFAPALSITAWLMLMLYLVEQQLYPRMRAAHTLSLISALVVLLAVVFPGAPLSSQHSAWMPLHLALGVACYGLFASAVVHAGLMTRAERRMRLLTDAQDQSPGVPLLTLERIMFRCVRVGMVLLSATLLVGMLFGETLYGHAWRWDHKNVFSLLAWGVFAVLLLGHARFGWRGRDAVRMVYVGAVLLLLAYAGSRFVLEVILGRGGV